MENQIWMQPEDAARTLRAGGIVAIPTETVYGLAGAAFNELALAKIFNAKKRPTFDPLILHIASLADVEKVAREFPLKARMLAEKFWPGPLTLVLPKRESVPDLATSSLPSVAVRFPVHPLAQEIIRLAETPLAAPSANLFKHLSPTTAQHVAEQLAGRIDGIVDGGTCSVGVESTIVSFAQEEPRLLRPGAITLEMLQECSGEVIIAKSSSSPGSSMESPGMLDTHYQPRTPLLYKSTLNGNLPVKTARLAFGKQLGVLPPTLNLSESGNLIEATANLYAYMHQLDEGDYDLILVDEIPSEGLGRALNDRLRRASSKKFF